MLAGPLFGSVFVTCQPSVPKVAPDWMDPEIFELAWAATELPLLEAKESTVSAPVLDRFTARSAEFAGAVFCRVAVSGTTTFLNASTDVAGVNRVKLWAACRTRSTSLAR